MAHKHNVSCFFTFPQSPFCLEFFLFSASSRFKKKLRFLTPNNDILNKITSCNSDSSYHPYFHSFHHSPLILLHSCLSLFVFAFILSDHYCYPISFLLSSFPNSHCICVLSFYDFVFTPHVAFYQIQNFATDFTFIFLPFFPFS